MLRLLRDAFPLFAGLAACLATTWPTGAAPRAFAAEAGVAGWHEIDWPTFLSRSDLVWQVLPDRWDRGAFTGNGLLGAMTYVEDGALSWELGRADVVDNQPSERTMVAAPRLPLGFLRWRGCEASQGEMRLDLWNAEMRGSLGAQGGTTKFRSFTHASSDVIAISVSKGGCAGRFEIDAATAISDGAKHRMIVGGQPVANPAVERSAQGTRRYALQRIARGGAHVIALDSFDAGSAWITYATVSRAGTSAAALARANEVLDRARRRGWSDLERTHRTFWHAYYPQSFVSLPDAQLESFYWIQMYKLASASRPNGPIVDTLGPWYHRTPWPGLWWNLNVQLSYWPVYTANRLALGESLVKGLLRSRAQLRANARPRPGMAIGRTSAQDLRSPLHLIDNGDAKRPEDPRENGNLLWALHNMWLHATHAMDARLERDVLGMLSEAVAYQASLLERGADGRLHLPLSYSPEYPKAAADTNYDLALLSWGLRTLLRPENQHAGSPAERQRWSALRKDLAPFPANEQGFMIGRDQPLEVSHRHFSHLLMIYPLGLLDPRAPADRDIINRSLAHWIGLEGALEGYSFVGASTISSLLGNGDQALDYLLQLIRRFVRRNTMYMEAGPVIETPLATAQAVHEMLLQSRNGEVFVLPALPATWRDVAFRNLRAPGAVLVSAERREGRTSRITVQSLAGKPFRLHLPKGTTLHPTGLPASRWQKEDDVTYNMRLERNETLAFVDPNAPPAGGAPVPHLNQPVNPFGSRTQNAWLPTQVQEAGARLHPTPARSAGRQHQRDVIAWELLETHVPTVFTQNGAEEIRWAHTSCDPCASQVHTVTATHESVWKPVAAPEGCFDFRKLLPSAPSKDAIAYVRGTFMAQKEGELELQIGLNDQGRVWWWANDAAPGWDDTVLLHAGASTLGKNEDHVRVKVKKGTNYVFVKTINEGGGWGACVKAKPVP